jgi:hypothetical protein
MRIRWDPVQVMDAADQLEGHVNRIVKPLEEARKAAEQARAIPNLPEYVKQRFTGFMFEVERTIGGVERTSYTWENGQSQTSKYISEGTLKRSISSIKSQVPQDALKEAKAQPTLLKIAK